MVEYIKKTTVLTNRCETIKKCRNPEPLSSLLREHVSMLAPQHQHHARDKTSVSSSFIIVYRWGTCGRLLHRVMVTVWNSDKKWGRNARQIASPSLASLHRCVFFPVTSRDSAWQAHRLVEQHDRDPPETRRWIIHREYSLHGALVLFWDLGILYVLHKHLRNIRCCFTRHSKTPGVSS